MVYNKLFDTNNTFFNLYEQSIETMVGIVTKKYSYWHFTGVGSISTSLITSPFVISSPIYLTSYEYLLFFYDQKFL
jgi:hypothetical protein